MKRITILLCLVLLAVAVYGVQPIQRPWWTGDGSGGVLSTADSIGFEVGTDTIWITADSAYSQSGASAVWGIGAGGETNTASNIGNGGIDVFKSKVGVDLQFRTIAASTNMTITETGDSIVFSSSGGGGTVTDSSDVSGWNYALLSEIRDTASIISETDPTLTDDEVVTIGDNSTASPYITFDAFTGDDGTLKWNEVSDAFEFSKDVVVGQVRNSTTENIILYFGGTNSESIIFDGAVNDDFQFSDGITTNSGDITSAGLIKANTSIHVNSDYVSGDENAIINFNASTQTLMWDYGDSRFELSNDFYMTGNLITTGTATIGAYTLPNTDGSADQILKTDGSGAVSWQAETGGSGTADSVYFNTSAVAPGTEYKSVGNLVKVRPGTNIVIAREDSTDFDLMRISHGAHTGDVTGTTALTISPDAVDSNMFNSTEIDEYIADKVGNMVTGNTETNITVTYQDADNTLDFVASAGGSSEWTSVNGDSTLQWYAANDTGLQISVDDDTTFITAGSNTQFVIGTGGMTYMDSLTVDSVDAGFINVGSIYMSADLITDFAGTNLSVAAGNLNVEDVFLSNTGDVGTGVYDFGGATSTEIVNSTSPTVNATGEIAIDTDADGNYIDQGWITYYDGSQQMYVPAFDAIGTPSDNDILAYNATSDKWVIEAQTGGAGETNTLSDTGTFNGTSGFGLAGGKTGVALKVKGLIEGSNITIVASGDSAYTITGSAGGSSEWTEVNGANDTLVWIAPCGDTAMRIATDESGDTRWDVGKESDNTDNTLSIFVDTIISDAGLTTFDSASFTEINPDTINISGDVITDFAGTALSVASGVLNVTEADPVWVSDSSDYAFKTWVEAEIEDSLNEYALSGGAEHDGFSDFVANEHIDWTADQGATNIHSGNYTDTDTQLSGEEVDDFVNALLNDADAVHTRITVTYDDNNNAMDFVVDDMNDDVPDAGDFGAATDLDANGALNTNSVSDNEINYTNVNMDDMTDGSTNAAITLTQETNFGTAYGWGDHASGGYAPTASPTFTGGITVPANSISDDEINEGLTFEWTAGHTWSSTVNMGAATSLEIPNGADPTTEAEGEIAWDSDDDFIEVYSGNESESAIIPIYESIQSTLFNPDQLTDSLPVYDVGALQWPGGIEIDSIQVTTSADGVYALGFIAYSNADPPVLGQWIDTLNVGTNDQKANSILFTDAAIEVGKTVYVSIPATDIDWVKFSIWFHGLGYN